MSETTLSREFWWASAYLSQHLQKLKSFISLSQELQRSILIANHDQAENILDMIQDEFGYSLWLIKNRLAVLQLSKGFEAQKRYAAEIRQQAFTNGIAQFVTYYVSFRIETVVSISRFTHQFHSRLADMKIPNEWDAYLRYHIIPGTVPTMHGIGSILRLESAASVVDYYETWIAMSRMAVVRGASGIQPIIISTLGQIEKDLCDPRIGTLLFHLGAESQKQALSDSQSTEAFDEFLTGDYAQCLSMTSALLAQDPSNLDAIETAARSLAVLQNNSIENILSPMRTRLSLMSDVLTKNKDSEKAASDLLKSACDFSTHMWASSLLSFVTKEMSPDPLEAADGLIYSSSLDCPQVHPLRIASIQYNNNRSSYAKALSCLCNPKAPSASYCAAFSIEDIGSCSLDTLTYEERTLITAERRMRNGEIELALDLAKGLLECGVPYYRQKAIRIVSHCLLALKRIGECVDFVASIFALEPYLKSILPVRRLIKVIDKEERKVLASKISLPIVYDMYVRFVGSEFESIRNYSYEDFLLSKGLSRPSELHTCVNDFKLELLVYFLRYICVESVIDCSTVFQGSQELARERVEVCRLLSEIDKENVEVYQTEIRDIHRKLMIKKRLREIEQSKVYVDTESIKKIAAQNLNEQYNRYIEFLRLGISPTDLKLRQSARTSAEKHDINAVLALALPQNEMNDLFESIIVQLCDQFVSSSEHGLDAYLSVRIRHGTFSGQLRSPLEANNLITQRDSTGNYRANQYWIDSLGVEEPVQAQRLAKCFADFSRKFDELIQEMVREWIQVKKIPSDKAVFDFTLYKLDVALLASYVTPDITFDTFVDRAFDYFTAHLEALLETMRSKIRNEAKPRASALVTSLQSEIARLSNLGIQTGRLTATIGKAHTDIQLAFDRVVEWFRFAKSAEKEPFTVEEAISISVDSLKTYHPNFDADISISEEMRNMRIMGHLPSFVDILFIIFENIVRHSHVLEPKAHVTVGKVEEWIILRVENEIAQGVANKEAYDRIENIKAAMMGKQYMKLVRIEGGTGFYKIRKILSYDVRSLGSKVEPRVDFGFQNDDRFFVEVAIPILGYRYSLAGDA